MAGPSDHDDLLFTVMKDCKTLPVFFDHLFGFLHRRTDYYVVAKDPSASMGLPPGYAETLVKDGFRKYLPKPQITQQKVMSTTEKTLVAKPKKLVENQDNKSNLPDSYNGAKFDDYSWSQTLTEIDVAIKLPEHTNSKELSVTILPHHISVKLNKTQENIFGGDLCDKCKHSTALWSIENRLLNIHLDKSRELWWNCLLMTESKLDIQTLDCSRPYEELTEDAKAKIHELEWNAQQRRLGLPTSDEIAAQNVLKTSWNVPGSPFSGAYDPDAVQFIPP